MSFGSSIGDLVLLTHLAWKTVQNCRRACGEYAALTLETTSLHDLLQRLESELQSPNGLIVNRDTDDLQQELSNIVHGCEKNLRVLDLVLEKYNALSETERSGRKLWQRIRFGNGQIADLADIRGRSTFYISAISLFLNMLNLGSAGRVEREMTRAGGELRDIRLAVNGITAYLMTGGPEGSVLTAYANDEKAVWKEFRRELVADGFTSSTIRKHKQVIMAYVKELGSRGLLDETDHHGSGGAGSRDISRAGPDRDTVQPELDKRSPNEPPAASLRVVNSVEDANPDRERSTNTQVEPSPVAPDGVSPQPPEPTSSLKRGPIPKDSKPTNSPDQEPPARTTTTASPTALDKLRSIELRLHTHVIPRCEAIIQRPPADRQEWLSAKPKELVEEILQQVIFELDAVDTEGDAQLRALRRDLVWQAQVWLVEVDAVSEPGCCSSSSDEVPRFSGVPEEDDFRDELDLWPPGISHYANGSIPRTRAPPIMVDDDYEGHKFKEIGPGISGKYAAWFTFAERYICQNNRKGGG